MFVALDFETTGTVKGYPNEPWQLGMVAFDPATGRISELWETYFRVSPDRPFSPHAPGRWAKIRDKLAAAPGVYEVWPEIAKRIIGAELVAHNAGTERTMLTKIAPITRLGPWHDTLKIVKERYSNIDKLGLSDLAESFAVADEVRKLLPNRTWHDALFDAAATAAIFTKLNQSLG